MNELRHKKTASMEHAASTPGNMIDIDYLQNYTHNQTFLLSVVLISVTIGNLIFVLDVAFCFIYKVPWGKKSLFELCVKSVFYSIQCQSGECMSVCVLDAF